LRGQEWLRCAAGDWFVHHAWRPIAHHGQDVLCLTRLPHGRQQLTFFICFQERKKLIEEKKRKLQELQQRRNRPKTTVSELCLFFMVLLSFFFFLFLISFVLVSSSCSFSSFLLLSFVLRTSLSLSLFSFFFSSFFLFFSLQDGASSAPSVAAIDVNALVNEILGEKAAPAASSDHGDAAAKAPIRSIGSRLRR
jgi:hypothetical protein